MRSEIQILQYMSDIRAFAASHYSYIMYLCRERYVFSHDINLAYCWTLLNNLSFMIAITFFELCIMIMHESEDLEEYFYVQ